MKGSFNPQNSFFVVWGIATDFFDKRPKYIMSVEQNYGNFQGGHPL